MANQLRAILPAICLTVLGGPAMAADAQAPTGSVGALAGVKGTQISGKQALSVAYATKAFAARNLSAGEILQPGDLIDPEENILLAENMIGKEVRRSLYKGAPVTTTSLRAPILVRRNAIVGMVFQRNGLMIRTEGRALDEGGDGALIRVMNLGSRATVTARVAGADMVEVGK